MKGEENAEAKIKSFDEVHQKYKFMENSLAMRCSDSTSENISLLEVGGPVSVLHSPGGGS